MSALRKNYRTREKALATWRSENRLRVYGFIASSAEGMVSNAELAEALALDPRGLRRLIERDPHFIVEIRGIGAGRGTPWYRINPAMKRPSRVPAPALMRTIEHRPLLGG